MPKDIINILYLEYLKSGKVSTDTRNLPDSCLFFALRGDNFNGNLFADQALEKGAAWAIVDDLEAWNASPHKDRLVLVGDVLEILQGLALKHREETDAQIIAIGGSNGKTTTKELLKAVLSTTYRTHATSGNLNNHIGVPLTLLSMPTDTEIAVIELGTNQPGDMKMLLDIVLPDMGLITNIGKEHLEGFGSLEGVAREEAELYRSLKDLGALAFVNQDDELLLDLSADLPRVITYGFKEEAHVSATLLSSNPSVSFETDKGLIVGSHLPGSFNLWNILAAWAVGRYLEIGEYQMAEAIQSYVPQNNRSQLLRKNGYTFFLDCYNANPSSMEVALQSLSEMEAPYKVAILGDMLELGEHSAAEHADMIKRIPGLGLNEVYLCGPEFSAIGSNYPSFGNSEALANELAQKAFPEGTLFFLKGSRGIAVEKAVQKWLSANPAGH